MEPNGSRALQSALAAACNPTLTRVDVVLGPWFPTASDAALNTASSAGVAAFPAVGAAAALQNGQFADVNVR